MTFKLLLWLFMYTILYKSIYLVSHLWVSYTATVFHNEPQSGTTPSGLVKYRQSALKFCEQLGST